MDRYRKLGLIGKGSFGKVYKVVEKSSKRFYVMKSIRLDGIPDEERVQCDNEVKLMQKLSHPNIVHYKESFIQKGHLYIVMTYCDGGDLGDLTKQKRAKRAPFKESQIMHWFVQILLGLNYMHSKDILHRDIKTQNIFLLGNGRLVLGDLGISKVLDGTVKLANTVIGTPYYMAPELFRNEPYGAQSDIWALGCVLFEMIMLRHPFEAESLNALAMKIMGGHIPQITGRWSRNIKMLVKHMLNSDPTKRPTTDQLMRLSFVKRHIVSLVKDIGERPQEKLGEATKMFKAGVLGAILQHISSDSLQVNQAGLDGSKHAMALTKQLECLEINELLMDAMGKESMAMNKLRQQANVRTKGLNRHESAPVLSREEAKRLRHVKQERLEVNIVRKQAVDQALAKLRAEKKQRHRFEAGQDRRKNLAKQNLRQADPAYARQNERVEKASQRRREQKMRKSTNSRDRDITPGRDRSNGRDGRDRDPARSSVSSHHPSQQQQQQQQSQHQQSGSRFRNQSNSHTHINGPDHDRKQVAELDRWESKRDRIVEDSRRRKRMRESERQRQQEVEEFMMEEVNTGATPRKNRNYGGNQNHEEPTSSIRRRPPVPPRNHAPSMDRDRGFVSMGHDRGMLVHAGEPIHQSPGRMARRERDSSADNDYSVQQAPMRSIMNPKDRVLAEKRKREEEQRQREQAELQRIREEQVRDRQKASQQLRQQYQSGSVIERLHDGSSPPRSHSPTRVQFRESQVEQAMHRMNVDHSAEDTSNQYFQQYQQQQQQQQQQQHTYQQQQLPPTAPSSSSDHYHNNGPYQMSGNRFDDDSDHYSLAGDDYDSASEVVGVDEIERERELQLEKEQAMINQQIEDIEKTMKSIRKAAGEDESRSSVSHPSNSSHYASNNSDHGGYHHSSSHPMKNEYGDDGSEEDDDFAFDPLPAHSNPMAPRDPSGLPSLMHPVFPTIDPQSDLLEVDNPLSPNNAFGGGLEHIENFRKVKAIVGEEKFNQAYEFLKNHDQGGYDLEVGGEDGDFTQNERDERIQEHMRYILGEKNASLWRQIDHLVFVNGSTTYFRPSS